MGEVFVNRCRACAVLQESSEKMISLFEKKLSEIFTYCTSLEIDSNDCLPSRICLQCFGHLSNFNKFRQNCFNSDAYFREQIVLESIKVEPRIVVDIKFEENASDQDFEPEFFEPGYTDENFAQYDQDISAPNIVTSAEDTDSAKYICDYCGKQFNQKNHIGAHMATHYTVRLKKTFPCTVNECRKVFKISQSLKNHMLKVHNVESQTVAKAATDTVKLYCPQCPKWFAVPVKLDAHIRSFHHGLKGYKCEQCEKEFVKYRSYCTHLRTRHGSNETEQEKHFCPYDGCDRSYGALDSLNTHIKRIHLGMVSESKNRRKLICDQCGRSFKNGFSLKEHSYSHSGIAPFACKICPKKFISNYKLKIHTMRHQNIKPFQCPTCGLRKTTNKELKAHLNFHSKEITYPCKECPRVFPSYGAINRHVRIHHRNHRPYVCPHCDRAFAKAETMRNHVMTHTGEKPFACSVCGHRFIQSVALKAHMKVHAKK